MQAVITALIDRPGRFIGTLVESRPLSTTRARWQTPALLALLLVAAIVRFWGVGSFGLHKPDEDTTALPAVHILQDGTPRFPSGMFYARAIVQSYLIAASVEAFGQSEWALRLPSVLSGLLLVLLAYFLGRRFLRPPWNLAFVAVVALLPGMIADSQEVRMYIFLSACLGAYMILLFRWERSGRMADLAAAVATLWAGVQFQEIAIFSSMLLLFPGLAHGDGRKLRQGVLALIVAGIGYLLISRWVGHFYPQTVAEQMPDMAVSQTGGAPTAGALRYELTVLLPALLLSMALVWFIVRTMTTRLLAAVAGTLLYLGLVSQALLLYHLAALLLIAGLIVARRNGGARFAGVLSLALASLALAAAHVWLLHTAHVGSARKIIGVMVGQPSIWPYLQVSEYSPVAMLLVVLALAAGLWRLAGGGRLHDDVLFAILGVFIPLFGIGFFGWYIPPRYGEFALLPLLLCALAAAQRFATGPSWATVLVAAAVAVAIVNPAAVVRSVNAGSSFADHREAARYMRSIQLGPRDIVVAEEVLMQTYYLGHVDYWLTGARYAAEFVVRLNGQLVDEYTDTPVISSAAALRKLVDRPDRGNIYIIGSGEYHGSGQLLDPDQSSLLAEPKFQLVYQAPDGFTRIWKVVPLAADSSAG